MPPSRRRKTPSAPAQSAQSDRHALFRKLTPEERENLHNMGQDERKKWLNDHRGELMKRKDQPGGGFGGGRAAAPPVDVSRRGSDVFSDALKANCDESFCAFHPASGCDVPADDRDHAAWAGRATNICRCRLCPRSIIRPFRCRPSFPAPARM